MLSDGHPLGRKAVAARRNPHEKDFVAVMTRVSILALLAVACCLAAASPAFADGTPPHPRMTEKELRAFETRLLGAQHAAEHARLRALERKQAVAARRHQRWLRSLPPSLRRTVERKER